jgi:hypothetical protein
VRHVHSFLASHAFFLAPSANPILLAWRFERRRRVRQFFARRARAGTLLALIGVFAGIAAVALGQRLRGDAAALVALLPAHLLSLAVAATLVATSAIVHGRRHAERQWATAWLASAPIAARDMRAALRRRLAARWLPAAVVVLVLLAAAGTVGAVTVAAPIGAVALGFAGGAVIGWYAGGRAAHAPSVATLPRLRQARHEHAFEVTLTALGRWPFAQLRAALAPRVHAQIVGAALVGMPMGIPAHVVVLALLLIATALGATALLNAQLAVIPRAADWLRATPLASGRFTLALCRRALAGQLVAGACGALLLAALGVAPVRALALAAAWLAWVLTATACALARRHRTGPLRVELVAYAALLLALTATLPAALAFLLPALWWRDGRRMRAA